MMKRTQTCVLRSESSSARNVDNQASLTLKLVEANGLAFQRIHREFEKCAHGANLSEPSADPQDPGRIR